ncbi:MAG: hypothetical protein JW908_00640 [Anaerolineales bacterium]|nr:hypothetical protein [Anaerolineales bacterium]
MANIGERLVAALGGVTQEALSSTILQEREQFQETLASEKQRSYEAGVSTGIEIASDGNDEKSTLVTADGKSISYGYKQRGSTPRDLSNISQEKAIEASYRLWNSNPLAGALIEIIVDYVVGEGIKVTSENEEIQEVLDAFLCDPVNDLTGEDGSVGSGLEAMVRELSIFGEQLILTFVRDGSDKAILGDGRVRIGTVDPAKIFSVITDPKNSKDILAVRVKSATGGGDGPVYKVIKAEKAGEAMEGRRNLKKYREAVDNANAKYKTHMAVVNALEREREVFEPAIIGKEWMVCESETQTLQMKALSTQAESYSPTGECFLFQVNKISTGVRGRPDILRMIDWMNQFDQVFFDGAEHVALLNAFAWDLTITDGVEVSEIPEKSIQFQAKKVSRMRPGSVYGHNQNAVLDPKNPDLKTAELEVLIRQLRILIAGGARIPEHWLGEGSRANRATAEVMGEPTFRMLTRRQAFVRGMLRRLCQYQIDVAVALGLLPAEVDILNDDGQVIGRQRSRKAFDVDMPDINVEDTSIAARSFALVAQAIAPLVTMNLLTQKDAMQLLAAVAKLVGVNIDVEQAIKELAEAGSSVDGERLQTIKDLIDSLKDHIGDEEAGDLQEGD